MADVIRVYVEKRSSFDVEAKQMLSDLRDNLGMKQITGLRLANRYDISGLTKEEFEKAKYTVFAEQNVDDVTEEALPFSEGYRVFAMEYLPGQYDQRADSAAQCVQLLTQGDRPSVVTARVIGIAGNLSDADF